jgi:hypothetical protein
MNAVLAQIGKCLRHESDWLRHPIHLAADLVIFKRLLDANKRL